MKTYNFEVRDFGDIDVGLIPTVSTVTINSEDNLSDEQIEITKLFLKDLFDSPSMVEVLGDKELAEEIKEQAEILEEYRNEEIMNNVLKLWRPM